MTIKVISDGWNEISNSCGGSTNLVCLDGHDSRLNALGVLGMGEKRQHESDK